MGSKYKVSTLLYEADRPNRDLAGLYFLFAAMLDLYINVAFLQTLGF